MKAVRLPIYLLFLAFHVGTTGCGDGLTSYTLTKEELRAMNTERKRVSIDTFMSEDRFFPVVIDDDPSFVLNGQLTLDSDDSYRLVITLLTGDQSIFAGPINRIYDSEILPHLEFAEGTMNILTFESGVPCIRVHFDTGSFKGMRVLFCERSL